jgi:hypothetical protein
MSFIMYFTKFYSAGIIYSSLKKKSSKGFDLE